MVALPLPGGRENVPMLAPCSPTLVQRWKYCTYAVEDRVYTKTATSNAWIGRFCGKCWVKPPHHVHQFLQVYNVLQLFAVHVFCISANHIRTKIFPFHTLSSWNHTVSFCFPSSGSKKPRCHNQHHDTPHNKNDTSLSWKRGGNSVGHTGPRAHNLLHHILRWKKKSCLKRCFLPVLVVVVYSLSLVSLVSKAHDGEMNESMKKGTNWSQKGRTKGRQG